MGQPPLTKTVGVCFGLAAFAIATLVGLVAGNAAADVLARALASMFVCYLIGMAVGFAFDHVAQERDAAHRGENPVPSAAETVESDVRSDSPPQRVESAPAASAA